jgi:hypothetical protein
MAEIYLAILVYHDLTLLLYYLSHFTVSTNPKKLKRPASADERQVAKKCMIKNPGKENFFLNGQKIVLGWSTRNTSNQCSATGAEIIKSTECLSKEPVFRPPMPVFSIFCWG